MSRANTKRASREGTIVAQTSPTGAERRAAELASLMATGVRHPPGADPVCDIYLFCQVTRRR